MPKSAKPVSRPMTVAVLIALGLGALLLRNYFSLIVVAAIVAYLFDPVYQWFLSRTKNTSLAATLTLLVTLFAIVVPVLLVLFVTFLQAQTFVDDISHYVNGQDFGKLTQEALDWINQTLSSITGQTVAITYDDVTAQLSQYATSIANYVIDLLKSWVGSLGGVITSVILYMYVFTGILVNRDRIIATVQQLNPLGKDITNIYIGQAQAMTKAMVKGQFIIAVIQGSVSALVLYLVGVPYTAFFLLILTFLSIIPLGAGIVTIPIGIGMMIFGNFVGGAIVVLNHLIVVTNIDNFLKPKLVPKSVRLHPALLLLAVFGGINLFGFLGIVIGPVLMILIVNTINIYLNHIYPKKPAPKAAESSS